MTYRFKGQGLTHQITGKQMQYNNTNMYGSIAPITSTTVGQSSIVTLQSNTVGTTSSPWTTSHLSAIPTVSIQGLSNSSYGNLGNLVFRSDYNISADVKKYEIYESPEDLLACSVAWQRLRIHSIPLGISSLLENKVFERIMHTDREKANEIRDYYSKKIMMWKLKGKKLTNFRNDLNTFVHSDGTKFKKEMLGLAYHLPNFYDYDVELDDVREQVNSKITLTEHDDTLNSLQLLKLNNSTQVKKLNPIKRVNRVTKRVNTKQYWFKDSLTNDAILLHIDNKNPLEHIWNDLFDNSKSMSLKGKYYIVKHQDFEYYSIKNWTLEKT